MFATPAATMTRKPYLGLPAVTKKLWKAYCKIEEQQRDHHHAAVKAQRHSASGFPAWCETR